MNVHSEMRDPYQALGVSPDASSDEIKRAYRRLAKEYHPDRNDGDKGKETRFKEISVAYDVLSDPDKRARYDAMQNGGGIPMDFGDLFAQFFGGGMGGGVGAGGSQFRVYQSGQGFGQGFGGQGFGGARGFSGGARQRAQRPQPRTSAPKERQVKASDGSTLLQKGKNTYADLRIPFDEAMLGTTAKVATLHGMSVVKVPPGTSSGQKLRLRGKGARSGSKQGDHFLTIHIDVPKITEDASRELVVELKKSLEKVKK
jgi:molecular chaperone DnaJ